MTSIKTASSKADDLLRRLRIWLFTEADFRRQIESVLDSLRQAGLSVCADVFTNDHRVAVYGHKVQVPAGSDSLAIEPLRVVISYGSASGTTPQDLGIALSLWERMRERIRAILEEHWRAREPVRAVWSGTDESVGTKLVRTVADAAESLPESHMISYVRLDCDGFGAIKNELEGEEQANEVMMKVASFFREELADNALVFHPHGDEFALVFLDMTPPNVVDRLATFQDRFEQQNFRPAGYDEAVMLGIRMVVAMWPHIETDARPPKVLERLRDAAEGIDIKSPHQRRFIWLVSPEPMKDHSLKREAIEEAVLSARRDLFSSSSTLFGNGILQVIVDRLFTHAGPDDALSACLDRLSSKLMLDVYACTDVTDIADEKASRYIHTGHLASAMIHVVLKRAFHGRGPLGPRDRVRLVIRKSEHPTVNWDMAVRRRIDGQWQDVLVYMNVEASAPLEADAGEVWRAHGSLGADGVQRWVPPSGRPVGNVLSPCLAVLVGSPARALLSWIEQWAAALVYIDDRPVTSGHLPDFWQSNVARIVVHCLRNPNIRTVIVVNDDAALIERTRTMLTSGRAESSGSQGDERVESDSDYVSRVAAATTIAEPALRRFYDRRLRIVEVAASRKAVRDAALAAFCDSAAHLSARGEAESIRLSGSFAKGPSKSAYDLRCKDLAEAYPRVLRLLRHRNTQRYDEPDGRSLAELTAVRIELAHALEGQIPLYWQQEQRELEAYFARAFSGTESLFGRRFLAWGTVKPGENGVDQREQALRRLVTVITEKRVDRRILLATPQPPGDSISDPLGLLAVHILPRVRQKDVWSIDFLWVWRSVEAIVGFPFSAYGSVRFAKNLVDELVTKLHTDCMNIRLGTVVYVALSLHLFCDEADLAIARRIDLEAQA